MDGIQGEAMSEKNEFEMALDVFKDSSYTDHCNYSGLSAEDIIEVFDHRNGTNHADTIRKALEFMAANHEAVRNLKDALRDVLKAVAFDNPHGVQDTIWVNGSPIGDFIMGVLDEDIDLDGLQSSPYRCDKTAEMQLIPDGYVIVPREPTVEMFLAGHYARKNFRGDGESDTLTDSIFKAMISAEKLSHGE